MSKIFKKKCADDNVYFEANMRLQKVEAAIKAIRAFFPLTYTSFLFCLKKKKKPTAN